MLHGSPRVSEILHSTVSVQSTGNLRIPRIFIASRDCAVKPNKEFLQSGRPQSHTVSFNQYFASHDFITRSFE